MKERKMQKLYSYCLNYKCLNVACDDVNKYETDDLVFKNCIWLKMTFHFGTFIVNINMDQIGCNYL